MIFLTSRELGLLIGLRTNWKRLYQREILRLAISPGPDRESNWLPTPPSGRFNLSTHVYQPTMAMFDGTYNLPPVTRVE